MSEPREATSIFLHQQTPTDFSSLKNVLNCLPCNLDGVTERMAKFLVLELKHGELLSVGQERMLRALAVIPQFTILIVDCEWTPPNAKGGRDFNPQSFHVLNAGEGIPGERYQTNVKDLAVRYHVWIRTPGDGARPFTCSVAEFQKTYLRWLPSDQQPKALSSVQSALCPEER